MTQQREVIVPEPGWARDFEAILEAYKQAGGDPDALRMPRMATMVVNANKVLAANDAHGVHFETEELPDGIRARIFVEPGTRVEYPIHLCFGMLPTEGVQRIDIEYEIGAGAQVEFLAHCTFPNAIKLQHIMDARIHVGANAAMTYTESHFHGPHGGIEVLPTTRVVVEDGGRFATTFSLVHGRVGRMAIDYDVSVGAGGVAEMTTKAYGMANDRIRVNEVLHLDGEGARGLTKTRVAVRDEAKSEVFTTAEGNAPFARGHMDCTEIVRGHAVARNVPVVVVRNDRARVTHEAAIGTVNHKELETLMARGLTEEEAVDVIIRGMLR
ncbi:MAG: SufD family Fe-S cluster assembly protein [Anaerolineae bacterium]|nr:SufD family Fe-S cluster assembly protein [Anaerolineae bacterium]